MYNSIDKINVPTKATTVPDDTYRLSMIMYTGEVRLICDDIKKDIKRTKANKIM